MIVMSNLVDFGLSCIDARNVGSVYAMIVRLKNLSGNASDANQYIYQII